MSERSRVLDRRPSPSGGMRGVPFAAALATSRTPMLVADARRAGHPIVFANQAFARLTGYAPDEAVGRDCRFLQGPDTDPGAVGRIRAALAAGIGIEVEILDYRKDGTPFWNALAISPVGGETGAPAYFLAEHRDASVERRIRDLEAALERTTVLLHDIDHRAKNALQVVASLILLKARRVRDEGTRQVLSVLAERIDALAAAQRLVQADEGVGRFDLSAFVADLAVDLAVAKEDRMVDFALRVEPVALSAAKAVPAALLVDELARNALAHAFPDGRGGTVSITAIRRGAMLHLAVADDGVGHGAPAESPEGLGLTLVDMLARQLRATLAWEDAGPGTRAVIALPLDADEILA